LVPDAPYVLINALGLTDLANFRVVGDPEVIERINTGKLASRQEIRH
jgi:hypothetical protein